MLGNISIRLFLFQAALFAEIQATCSDVYVGQSVCTKPLVDQSRDQSIHFHEQREESVAGLGSIPGTISPTGTIAQARIRTTVLF